MKAGVVYGIRDLRYEDINKPKLIDGSVLVKIHSCAICGTDKRIFTVGDPRAQYPVVIGHEIAGEIVEVSDKVKDFKVGDRVCVAPGHGCGYCKACTSGYPNLCVDPHPSMGYKIQGGFAEYIAVPEHIFRLGFVNRIPENLSYDEASMSEIIACCLNAHKNTAVHKGDVVLILGAGPAGIVHSVISKLKGASKVILAQHSHYRLEKAKALFPDAIDRVVALGEESLEDVIKEETGGFGADVIFVCAPSSQAQVQAISLAGPQGRINFFGGLPKNDKVISFDANQIHYKELHISGASSSLPESNREALNLLSRPLIDGNKLITHRFPLSDINEAFRIAESRNCVKIVINPCKAE